MIGLSLAALFLAFLQLEASSAGIFMLSRPLVVGVGLGLAFREMAIGWHLGVAIEMLSLEHLPLGSELVPNAVVAAGMAVLFALGPNALPPALALPAGLGLGGVYCLVENKLKSWRGGLAEAARESLEKEGEAHLGRLMVRSLALEWALAALFLFIGLWLVKPLLLRAWFLAPKCARQGLAFAYGLAPGLGLVCLVQAFVAKAGSGRSGR